MAISTEYAQAVSSNKILRVRIMLKDSLLLDKSFGLFDEMRRYALAKGMNIWSTSETPLEIAPKPWTMDIMNYELTALVNDFTEEHVKYVKDIIRDLYGGHVPNNNQHTKSNELNEGTGFSSENRYHILIVKRCNKIRRILLERTIPGTKTVEWDDMTDEDIQNIKAYAQDIVNACSNLQRRG